MNQLHERASVVEGPYHYRVLWELEEAGLLEIDGKRQEELWKEIYIRSGQCGAIDI